MFGAVFPAPGTALGIWKSPHKSQSECCWPAETSVPHTGRQGAARARARGRGAAHVDSTAGRAAYLPEARRGLSRGPCDSQEGRRGVGNAAGDKDFILIREKVQPKHKITLDEI